MRWFPWSEPKYVLPGRGAGRSILGNVLGYAFLAALWFGFYHLSESFWKGTFWFFLALGLLGGLSSLLAEIRAAFAPYAKRVALVYLASSILMLPTPSIISMGRGSEWEFSPRADAAGFAGIRR